MKNFFKKSCCAIVFTILLTSCSETVDHEFSHDDDINNWVRVNQKEISKYDRNDILDFSIKKQKAILRALPSEKKKKIWQEKVIYILELDLSKEEKKFLKWFGVAFKKMDYEEPISQKFSDELYEKVMVGVKKFNWSKEFVYSMFFSVGDLNEKKSKILSSGNVSNSHAAKVQEEPDTYTCYYSVSCTGWNNTCSEPDECKFANNDCGVFGNTTCDGYCTSDISNN